MRFDIAVGDLQKAAQKALASFDKHVTQALSFVQLRQRFRVHAVPPPVADTEMTEKFFGITQDEHHDLHTLKVQFKAYRKYRIAMSPDNPELQLSNFQFVHFSWH